MPALGWRWLLKELAEEERFCAPGSSSSQLERLGDRSSSVLKESEQCIVISTPPACVRSDTCLGMFIAAINLAKD